MTWRAHRTTCTQLPIIPPASPSSSQTALVLLWICAQIWYNGTWGSINHDGWDWHEARVACRQLGFVTGRPVGSAKYGMSRCVRRWLLTAEESSKA